MPDVVASVRQRPWLWLLGTVALLLLVLVAVMAFQARTAVSAMNSAQDQARLVQNAIADGDVDAAKSALVDLRESSREARQATDGPLWSAAERLPWLGDDVGAVRTIARVLDDIASDGLPPVVEVADSVQGDTFRPRDGQLDIVALEELSPAVSRASTALTAGKSELEAFDPENVIGPLREPLTTFKDRLDRAEGAARGASLATRLMPGMLGGDGPRRYLLITQNNAEVRSTGGLPGAWAIIEADDGRISLGEQGSAGDILRALDQGPPVVDITDEEDELFTTRLNHDFRNTNLTPDFPRTAEISRAMVEQALGVELDGVLSIDPVALSYILEGTGPIEMPDGRSLNGTNAVDILLNQVYLDFETNPEQDAYFAAAAGLVFDGLTSGQGETHDVIAGLAQAATEGRVLLWSAHESEQRSIANTIIGGALPADDGHTPQIGIYLNDGTGAKMQYYFDAQTTVEATRCADEQQTFEWATVFTSTAPADAADLTTAIIGPGFGSPPGSQLVTLRLYAPFEGSVSALMVDGEPTSWVESTHQERTVLRTQVLLEPGDEIEVSATLTSGPDQLADAQVSMTPLVRAGDYRFTVPSAC